MIHANARSMDLVRLAYHVTLILVTYMWTSLTGNDVAAISDITKIRHMFPGVYNNKLQYESDIALEVPKQEIHHLMNVNVSLWNNSRHTYENVTYFRFRARGAGFNSFTVEKMFSVQEQKFPYLIVFVIYNRRISGERNVTDVWDLDDTTQCKMSWQRTIYGSYRNVDISQCHVDGLDDRYLVNTTMELSDSYFNVLEMWFALPRITFLDGPTTAFHFIKQSQDSMSLR